MTSAARWCFGQLSRSPWNDFAIAPELTGFVLRSVHGEPDPPTPSSSAELRRDERLRRDKQFRGWCYQGITFRSLKNLPVIDCGASDANHTTPEAPSATERVAFEPPISVRTQPGHTEFTANFGNAAASCTVTPLSAVFEMQYAGAQPSAPSVNWPPPLETFTMRGASLFFRNGTNARDTSSAPSVFVRIVVSNISGVMVSTSLSSSSRIPALFTSVSRRSLSLENSSAARRMLSGLETSILTNVAVMPLRAVFSPWSFSTAASPAFSSRAPRKT